jgi:trans-aconitate methyltransferase
MSNNLFELSKEYDSMLNQGLSVSGENKLYFLDGRINDLKNTVNLGEIKSVLDFGCGIGDSSARLAEVFSEATVYGIDTAVEAINYAQQNHSSERVQFRTIDNFAETDSFDLCYVNGVFHHIIPKQRINALTIILKALKKGGKLALFENNPLNLGTRYIMSKIPFDADAQTILPNECRKLVLEAGFSDIIDTRFLFYFPKVLSPLRVFEKKLIHLPLGAQYYVLCAK